MLELLAGSDVVLEDRPRVVIRVVDGDTLVVTRRAGSERVRLIGINAPESVDPRRGVQCFGREAARRAAELARGKSVYLATDPSQSRIDDHGRLLAYVWLPDGRMLNLRLLAEGYANEYTYDRAHPYAFQESFRAARDDAARLELGLWAPDTCAGDFDAVPAAAPAGRR